MADFLSGNNLLITLLLLAWTLPWKGVALWKAARLYHRNWFIALLILNTLAILDIIYIFFVAKRAERAVTVEDTAKTE